MHRPVKTRSVDHPSNSCLFSGKAGGSWETAVVQPGGIKGREDGVTFFSEDTAQAAGQVKSLGDPKGARGNSEISIETKWGVAFSRPEEAPVQIYFPESEGI